MRLIRIIGLLAFSSWLLVTCVRADYQHQALPAAIQWYTGAAGIVDDQRAHDLLLDAAASGDTLSIMWIARVHSTGRMGFERDRHFAEETAATVIQDVQLLTEAGNHEAMFLMGTAYAEGLGKTVDTEAAALWYERAAVKGNMLAQHNMGNIYASGTGVEQSNAKAVSWWRQAAEQGDAIPQFRLAEMLETGKGTAVDLQEAVRWYQDSASRGYQPARQALLRLDE